MSKIVFVFFVILSRCSSAMNFTMEIFSTIQSDNQRLLSTMNLSENDIKKLTRNNGLRRQARRHSSSNICESTKERLNNTELKRLLCTDKIFRSQIRPEILMNFDKYRGMNNCDRNLIIITGTSQKIRTNCKCNSNYQERYPCLKPGGPHCDVMFSKGLCSQLASQWEKPAWRTYLSDPSCNIAHYKSEKERIWARQACCVNKMTNNPRLECKKIKVDDTFLIDDQKTKVDFFYKVCKNNRNCNDNDLTKMPFTIHIKNKEICTPILEIPI